MHLLLQVVHGGHIAVNAQKMNGLRPLVAHRQHGEFRQVHRILPTAVGQQPGPGLAALDLAPHLLVDPGRGALVG